MGLQSYYFFKISWKSYKNKENSICLKYHFRLFLYMNTCHLVLQCIATRKVLPCGGVKMGTQVMGTMRHSMGLPRTAYSHQQLITYRNSEFQVSDNVASDKEIIASKINYFKFKIQCFKSRYFQLLRFRYQMSPLVFIAIWNFTFFSLPSRGGRYPDCGVRAEGAAGDGEHWAARRVLPGVQPPSTSTGASLLFPQTRSNCE